MRFVHLLAPSRVLSLCASAGFNCPSHLGSITDLQISLACRQLIWQFSSQGIYLIFQMQQLRVSSCKSPGKVWVPNDVLDATRMRLNTMETSKQASCILKCTLHTQRGHKKAVSSTCSIHASYCTSLTGWKSQHFWGLGTKLLSRGRDPKLESRNLFTLGASVGLSLNNPTFLVNAPPHTHRCSSLTCMPDMTCIIKFTCFTWITCISCIICICFTCITCINCITCTTCITCNSCINCIIYLACINCIICITCINWITCNTLMSYRKSGTRNSWVILLLSWHGSIGDLYKSAKTEETFTSLI